MRHRDYDEAIRRLTEALALDPTNAVALRWRSSAFMSESRWDDAIADYDKALQGNSMNLNALLYRGCAYRAKGDFKKTIADISAYLKINPTNDVAFKNRASAYNCLGEFTNAIADWNEGLRLNPNDALAIAMRGCAYNGAGQYQAALDDYHHALRLEPKCHQALNCFAWLRATCPEASFRDGKQAVRLVTYACLLFHGSRWEYLDTLAAALAECGEFGKAIEQENRALEDSKVPKEERQRMLARLKLYRSHKPYHGQVFSGSTLPTARQQP